MKIESILKRSRFGVGLIILVFIAQALVAQAAPRAVWFDYFGTGRTNYVRVGFAPSGQIYYDILRNPVTNPPQTRRVFWGRYDSQTGTGDRPLNSGDWDGDFKADIAVWRPGVPANSQSFFYIQPSSNPNSLLSVPWGIGSDDPVTGDFDGDGKDDFAITRNEGNQKVWWILPSGGGAIRRIVFGLASDGGAIGGFDFNNDGRDDLAISRISQNGTVTHYIGDAATGSLILAQEWGSTVTAGDHWAYWYGNYTGDSRADIVFYYGVCPSSNPNCGFAGTFWVKETGNANYTVTKWGFPANFITGFGDFPDIGDYDGDGKFDISVFRPMNSTYYTILSSNGQFQFQRWAGLGNIADGAPLDNLSEPPLWKIPASALSANYVLQNDDGTFTMKRGIDYLRTKR